MGSCCCRLAKHLPLPASAAEPSPDGFYGGPGIRWSYDSALLLERSPSPADDMVGLACFLLGHPEWGPSLRNKILERRMPIVAEGQIQNYEGHFSKQLISMVADMVRAACCNLHIRLAGASTTGLALVLLPLCVSRERQSDLAVECDHANEEAVAAFYEVLSGHRYPCSITQLNIAGTAFGTRSAATRLGDCLGSNKSTITSFIFELPRGGQLGGGGLLNPVFHGLRSNTTLEALVIRLSDSDVDAVEGVASRDEDHENHHGKLVDLNLGENSKLRCLDIIRSGIVCNDVEMIQLGLSQNTTLEELTISVDTAGAQVLMDVLKGPTSVAGPHFNFKTGVFMGMIECTRSVAVPHLNLKTLCLGEEDMPYRRKPQQSTRFPRAGELVQSACFPTAAALVDMLVSNMTLTKLQLCGAPYNNQEWAIMIFPALATNHTLEELFVDRCPGVGGGLVYDAMLELLDSNMCIQGISLTRTPLQAEGRAGVVYAAIKVNKEYGAALKNVPTVATTSCRLVLCGYPFAGKTTFLQSMLCRHSSHSVGAATTPTRTRGIDIQELRINGLTMWVWDFAGQKEFHPLQDFIFPNATSVHAATAFVFTFNPILSHRGVTDSEPIHLKEKHQFEHEFVYWLKFILSNTKQLPARMCKPLVLIVVTHKDQLDKVVSSAEKFKFHMMVEEWVRDMAWEFKSMISLDEANLFFVDATNKDDLDFPHFERRAIQLLQDRIRDVHQVPIVCDDIARALGGSGGQQLEPIISFANFMKLCQRAVEASTKKGDKAQQDALAKLMSGTKGKAARVIAAYLRDAGEVLYFSDLDFLVRNPRWFAHGILGHLIDIFPPDNAHPTQNINLEGSSQSTSQVDSMIGSGLVSKEFLAKVLQRAIHVVGLNPVGTNTDQLILLMEKLDLCYNTGKKYLIPALLLDKDGKAERGECKREWLFDLPSSASKCIFVSRRLQCSDRLRTFITPGFFPRLQVVLQRKAYKWDINKHATSGKPKQAYELEKYFCRLRHDDMEILVEHSGSYDYFVDIMVKSYKSREDTEKFLRAEVIDKIWRLCASSKGCQGVTLVEAIIRPDCVGENIVPCRHRQSILVADLKERMATNPEYKCYWEQVEDEKCGMLLPAAMHDPQRLLDGAPHEADECYPDWNVRRGKKRGLAVIISMEKYKSGDRPGGSADRENLKALAQSLHFEEHVMVDYTASEVIRALKAIAEEKVLEEHESFVCFVNGHGDSIDDGSEEHYFRDQDDEMLFLDSIVRPFRHCKHLQDKPKVFFVNSCRGSNKLLVDKQEQCGTSEQQQQPTSQQLQPTSQQLPKEAKEYQYVRHVKDCLIVFSASGRSASARDPQVGTSFVGALRNAFCSSRRQMRDVLGVVCCAIHEVAAQEHRLAGDVTIFGQCPVYVSSLTKLLYWR